MGSGFSKRKGEYGDKDKTYRRRIPISRTSGGVLRVATSSYAGEIQAEFHGFGAARCLKSMLSELLFGNDNTDIVTRIRNDNSSAVEHAHSINSAAKYRRLNGFISINREDLGRKSPVSLIKYNGGAKNFGRGGEKTTHRKLTLLLSGNIPQKAYVEVKGGIRKTYTSGRQYLAFPETRDGQGDLHTFTRRRDGLGRWEMGN